MLLTHVVLFPEELTTYESILALFSRVVRKKFPKKLNKQKRSTIKKLFR